MRPRKPLVTSVLALCLILFQAQALARLILPCQHAQPVEAGCPFHAAVTSPSDLETADDTADPRAFDCVKCALTLALGSIERIADRPSLATTSPHTPPASWPARHYYRFFPERFDRPPRLARL